MVTFPSCSTTHRRTLRKGHYLMGAGILRSDTLIVLCQLMLKLPGMGVILWTEVLER
jgi:hypothetical protein